MSCEHNHEHSHEQNSCSCSCSCSCGHSHEHEEADTKELIIGGIGAVIGFVGIALLDKSPYFLAVIILGYLLLGKEVLLNAGKNILHGEIFDENFLMAAATLGAFAIGEYPEALAVMLLYQIGEYLQGLAVDRSRKHLSEAMNIKPEFAHLKTVEGLQTIAPEKLALDDIILVKPKERIPTDGIILEGSSFIDTSSLTGESVPRKVAPGDNVLSGCLNGEEPLTLRVTTRYENSTVARVLDLVENASARKAPTENFITRFARVYTPIVVFLALALAILPPVISGSFDFIPWIYKACGFLVASCPCALVISVPLGFFGGIGSASRHGIIIKGSNYLELLNDVGYAVFDKTGTLTKGTFTLTRTVPAEGFTADEILALAASLEALSTHPIAQSIEAAYTGSQPLYEVSDYREIAGYGVEGRCDGKVLFLGSRRLLENNGINVTFSLEKTPGSVVYLSIDNSYAGYFLISDELKADTKTAIEELKSLGIHTLMLTGDTKETARLIAEEIGIDTVYSELLPADKVAKVEDLIHKQTGKGKEKLLFVGDGINDAPVLARADIGIAMGGIGSDAAVEAADIVLMTDEPSKLKTAITIAQKTRKIVTENIVFSLSVKILVLLFLAIGLGNMWLAVFADVGVALIAILNSLRVLR
ncbi:MAG: heavy metal translocating P-type ATPase [Acetivibrio ethanolgignens]